MDKRTFVKISALAGTGLVISPMLACNSESEEGENNETPIGGDPSQEFQLPDLSFDFNALEPNIDAVTMEIHHGKHHAGYVTKLNAALVDTDFAGQSLKAICKSVTEEHTAVRNNGGGHFNHTLFWESLSPDGQVVSGDIASAIDQFFGSFDAFKEEFSSTASKVFGSGWAWLCKDSDGSLFITSTPNQDNPLMAKLVEKTGTPLLGLDVWEHAYYLNYQNRRGDYIENFFNVINWETVNQRLLA